MLPSCPIRFALALGLALLGASLACSQDAAKKDELAHPQTLEEWKAATQKVLERNHVTGAGVALVSGGELIWCGGFGKADLAARRDISCDTEFRVGSISKTFVDLALLKLAEGGKIDLNARLRDIAPEIPVKNPWEASNPVLVAQVLEHTAGFDDMSFSEVYNLHDPANMPLLEVLKAHPDQQNVRWVPGSRFSYSNPGYGIAGYLIEKVSGQPFDSYIRESILAPLGITTGGFRLTAANRPLLAEGYESNPAKIVPYREIYLRPAGDLKASPAELARLVQFFLRRGTAAGVPLLSPASIDRMETVETALSAKNGLKAGYGLANYSEVDDGVVSHGHSGGIDGFISTYRYVPQQDWGYVVLLNSTVSGKALADMSTLAARFLSKDLAKPQVPAIPLRPEELQAFAGYYEPRAPRNQSLAFIDDLTGGFHISVKGGALVRKARFGEAEEIVPVGKNLFRGEKEPEATSVFFSGSDGERAFSSAGIDGTAYAVRTSGVWPIERLLLLGLSAVLMLSSLLFAIVWILRWLFRKMPGVKHLSVRIVPLLAVLTFVAVIVEFGGLLSSLGEKNVNALVVYSGTILFPALAVAGVAMAWRAPKTQISRGVRIHSLLVSLACCVVAAFLASWHLIGFRAWAP